MILATYLSENHVDCRSQAIFLSVLLASSRALLAYVAMKHPLRIYEYISMCCTNQNLVIPLAGHEKLPMY